MDYEKMYKEALERAKIWRDKYCTHGNLGFGDVLYDKTGDCQKELDNIFPELKESGDEKIRKDIIYAIHKAYPNIEDVNRCLTWLEKRKPEAGDVKFKIGDKITNGISTYTIDSIEDDCYRTKDGIGIPFNMQHRWEIVEDKQKELSKIEQEKEDISELTEFEAELFSMMSDAWQGYLRGEEVNIAKIVKEHSSELLERANK